jgi:hypothetical protein
LTIIVISADHKVEATVVGGCDYTNESHLVSWVIVAENPEMCRDTSVSACSTSPVAPAAVFSESNSRDTATNDASIYSQVK